MKNHHTIRIATRRDAAKLLEIYAPYVEKTAVTFEYEVPEVQEFEERIGHVLEKYPFLICEREGEIAGYAYAGVFKNRAAYRWAVETTVYVREDRKKMGIGRLCLIFFLAEYPESKRLHCLSGGGRPLAWAGQRAVPRTFGISIRRKVSSVRVQVRPLVPYGVDGKTSGSPPGQSSRSENL